MLRFDFSSLGHARYSLNVLYPKNTDIFFNFDQGASQVLDLLAYNGYKFVGYVQFTPTAGTRKT